MKSILAILAFLTVSTQVFAEPNANQDDGIYDALNVTGFGLPTPFPMAGYRKNAGRLTCTRMVNTQTKEQNTGCELAAPELSPLAADVEMSGPKDVTYSEYAFEIKDSQSADKEQTLSVDVDKYTFQGCYAANRYDVAKIDLRTYVVKKIVLPSPASLCTNPRTIENGITVKIPMKNLYYANLLVEKGVKIALTPKK